MFQTGSLYCGLHYDAVYDAIELSGLDHEELRGFQVVKRFNQLALPEREHVLYVDNGGVIDSSKGFHALFKMAKVDSRSVYFLKELLNVVTWCKVLFQ